MCIIQSTSDCDYIHFQLFLKAIIYFQMGNVSLTIYHIVYGAPLLIAMVKIITFSTFIFPYQRLNAKVTLVIIAYSSRKT